MGISCANFFSGETVGEMFENFRSYPVTIAIISFLSIGTVHDNGNLKYLENYLQTYI